jgi:hypothetical protein
LRCRYAFSPLLDAADEEDEDDQVMNDAFGKCVKLNLKLKFGFTCQIESNEKCCKLERRTF